MADITTNLVLHLQLDESSGASTFVDSSSSSNDGTEVGSLTAGGAGKFDASVEFSGSTSNYISLGSTVTLTGDFTISFWMRPDTVSSAKGIIFGTANVDGIQMFNGGADACNFRVNSNNNNRSMDQDFIVGRWVMVTITRTSTAIAFFVNGLEQTASASATVVNYDLNRIGLQATVNAFDGDLDDIRVYSRALADADILKLLEPYLEIHYKLDETSGTDATDSSGNSNDGTLAGGLEFDGTAGKLNNALNFPGDDNTMFLTSVEYMTPANLTLAAWVREEDRGDTRSIAVNRGTTWTSAPWLWRVNTSGTVFFQNSNGPIAGATGALSVDTWTHLAVVWDTGYAQHYVNGVASGSSGALSMTSKSTQEPIRIGGNWSSAVVADLRWSGEIDDFRLYSRALTVAEIRGLMSPYYEKMARLQTRTAGVRIY